MGILISVDNNIGSFFQTSAGFVWVVVVFSFSYSHVMPWKFLVTISIREYS